MTLDELTSVIAKRLGNRTDLNDAIQLEMKLAQQNTLERLQRLPWFLLSDFSWTVTVPGEQKIQIPNDFLREARDGTLWVKSTDDEWLMVTKKEFDYLSSLYGSYVPSDGERASHYALSGKYFYLFPTPNTGYEVRMRYFQKDTVMTTGTDENLWAEHEPDLLINATGMKMSSYISNKTAMTAFREGYVYALDQMEKHETAREMANRDDLSFGGDD